MLSADDIRNSKVFTALGGFRNGFDTPENWVYLMNLRNHARDQPCMVRVPEVCNGNQQTTVLAHYRLSGVSGMGVKSPDVIGAWACSACHAWIDTNHSDEAKVMHLEGMVRTINALVKGNYLKW